MSRDTLAAKAPLDARTVRLIHDMRNGLASLRAATHMLSRSSSDQAVVGQVVEGIQAQVKEMIELMDEFVGQEPTPEAASTVTSSADSGPLRVLVADDNVDSANTLATYLRMQSHQVTVAFDGETAWQLASTHHPHVMLLDISMPHLDGYELASRIRAQPWSANVRLIAVSGWLSPEQRARALASGYDAQVNKPIDMDALEALLHTAAAGCRQPA